MKTHTTHLTFETAERRESIRITESAGGGRRGGDRRGHGVGLGDAHHRGGEDNRDAHFKNLPVHHRAIVPVTAGRLDLGPWQQVFYCEFDRRRPGRLLIKAMGG